MSFLLRWDFSGGEGTVDQFATIFHLQSLASLLGCMGLGESPSGWICLGVEEENPHTLGCLGLYLFATAARSELGVFAAFYTFMTFICIHTWLVYMITFITFERRGC